MTKPERSVAAPVSDGKTLVIRGLFFSALMQGSLYIFGFILIPYLTRVLGAEAYGALAFSTGVNMYVWLSVDWGFSVGATRAVAANRGNPDVLRKLFWGILSAKAILGICIGVATVVGLLCIDSPGFNVTLAPALITVFGILLSMDWFVQGMERMGSFALTTVLGRATSVGLTVLLVHRPEDVWLAAILQATTGLLGALAGLAVVRRLVPLGSPSLGLRTGWQHIRENWHYFLIGSNALLYAGAAPLVLNFTSGTVAVGLFAAGDKILKVCLALMTPAATVMYPRTVALLTVNRHAAAFSAGRSLLFQLVLSAVMSAGMFFGADFLTGDLLGVAMASAAPVVQWLAVVPLIASFTRVLTSQVLFPLGWSAETARIVNITSLFYASGLALLGWLYGPVGAAIAFIIAELIQVVQFITLLGRKDEVFLKHALSGCNPLNFLKKSTSVNQHSA